MMGGHHAARPSSALGPGLVVAMGAAFAFLYVPILLLIVYSFNDSRLVTVWGGWSTRWYAALLANRPLMEAAWLSLQLAALSATLATVLAVLIATALNRFGAFRGRALLFGLAIAPMVMPEIVTGLSLLLLFVTMGIDRGFGTIAIAHTTFTIGFATLIVQAGLRGLDPRLEEAAIDLGAPPLEAFVRVTLPLLLPSLAAAWLLAFTLSLDDLVIASFTSGPGASTLPMRVYSSVRLGVTPEINALSTLLIGAVALVLVALSLLTKTRAR